MSMRAQLEALALQLQAAHAQVAALLEQHEEESEDAPEAPCPRCGGREFAHAGDLAVCAGCNANLLAGELVDG